MAYKAKPRWTKTQELYLRENHKEMTDEQIARHLGKTPKAITQKRQRLGLPKEPGAPIGNNNRVKGLLRKKEESLSNSNHHDLTGPLKE